MSKRAKAWVGALAGLVLVAAAGCDGEDDGAGPAGVARTGATSEVPAITGTGTGRVRGTPDTMTVDIGVDTRGASAQEALERNRGKAGKVLEALGGAGVEEDDIQTSQLYVSPVFGDDGEQITGYEVVNAVIVTVHELDDAGAIIDAAVAVAGDDIRVNGVSFSIEDTGDLVAAARAEAVKRARAQAEQLAGAAGLDLGDVLSIEEVGGEPGPPVVLEGDVAGQSAATPIEPGTQELTVEVIVRFAID